MFQDWARREAARPTQRGPVTPVDREREEAAAAAAPSVGDAEQRLERATAASAAEATTRRRDRPGPEDEAVSGAAPGDASPGGAGAMSAAGAMGMAAAGMAGDAAASAAGDAAAGSAAGDAAASSARDAGEATGADALTRTDATAEATPRDRMPADAAGGEGDDLAGPWDGWIADPQDRGSDPSDPGYVPPRRRTSREWAAPPPWSGAGGSGPATNPADAGDDADVARPASGRARASGDEATAPPFLADREPNERRLSGRSAAGRDRAVEPGWNDDAEAGEERDWDEEDPGDVEPAGARTGAAAGGIAGAIGAFARRAGGRDDADARGAGVMDDEYDDLDDRAGPRAAPRRRSIAAGRFRDTGRDPDGEVPPWERPRRYEAYPSLKTPVSLPRLGPIALGGAVLVLAALLLFFVVPNWLGVGAPAGGGGDASPTPGASASASASAPPATPAAPTPIVYVIKSNDTLSKIAKKFGVTVDQLLEANKATIKDPNKIGVGQQIIIPTPEESAAEPSPSASG